MFNLIMFLLIIISVEGITELFVNKESIVHKLFVKIFDCVCLPAVFKELLLCGFCFSLQVSLILNLMWLFTDYSHMYFLCAISTWRLSNMFHTFYSWLLRKKMFVQ